MATLLHLQPGMIFARDFKVIRPLAEGGMGAVYVAEQLSTGHQRALKVMHPGLVADPKQRERFAQEARVGAQINSAHVVEVAAAGIDEATGTPWIAMELLVGDDLATVMRRRGTLSTSEVSEIFEQLGDALGKAHTAGIVHRDLKPENIFIAESRMKAVAFVAKVLDFGISKIVAEHKTAATVTSAIGSPMWMAPEQTNRGAKIRASTDVWPIGLIAFYLLTGRFYWSGANAPDDEFNLSGLLVEIMVTGLETATVRAGDRAPLLPRDFDSWFARCVHRDPDARFRNASEAVAALLPLLSGQPAGAAPMRTMPIAGASMHPLANTRPALGPSTEVWNATLQSDVPSGAMYGAPAAPSRPLSRAQKTAIASGAALTLALASGAVIGSLGASKPTLSPTSPTPITAPVLVVPSVTEPLVAVAPAAAPRASDVSPTDVPHESAVRPQPIAVRRPHPAIQHPSVPHIAPQPPDPAPPAVPPNSPLPEVPSRADIIAAMRGVTPAVRSCGFAGSVSATVVFASSGAVVTVDVTGSNLAAGEGACVARAIHTVTVPRFSRPTFRMTYPFTGRPVSDYPGRPF